MSDLEFESDREHARPVRTVFCWVFSIVFFAVLFGLADPWLNASLNGLADKDASWLQRFVNSFFAPTNFADSLRQESKLSVMLLAVTVALPPALLFSAFTYLLTKVDTNPVDDDDLALSEPGRFPELERD